MLWKLRVTKSKWQGWNSPQPPTESCDLSSKRGVLENVKFSLLSQLFVYYSLIIQRESAVLQCRVVAGVCRAQTPTVLLARCRLGSQPAGPSHSMSVRWGGLTAHQNHQIILIVFWKLTSQVITAGHWLLQLQPTTLRHIQQHQINSFFMKYFLTINIKYFDIILLWVAE